MTFNPFSSRPLIGLHVEADGVRLVQLKKNRRCFFVANVAVQALPDDVFTEGKVKRWDVLQAVLAELVQTMGLAGQPAAINLSANWVRMQCIQLPSGLTEVEIEAEIDEFMRRDWPGMTDALAIDFTLLPQKNRRDENVFFAATRQVYLSHYVECVNAAGLKVKIVDVDIYSLKRAACFALDYSTNEVSAIVHKTGGVAILILFNAQDILFHQQWDVAEGEQFLTQIKNNIQMGLDTLRHIEMKRLIVCGDKESEIQREIMAGMQIDYPDPFVRMKWLPSVEAQFASVKRSDLLIACGAAMREVPLW